MKFTYEYIKSYIESFDYTLLSDTYEKSDLKLLIKCDKGHEYKAKFNSFQQGHRCAICGGTQKHSYDYVKSYIESTGYTLLSDTYKNSTTNISIMCDKGHEFETTFGSFKHCKTRCTICAGNKKHSYEYVKQFIKNENYTLLSDTYENNHTKLVVKCGDGHMYEVSFHDFKKGYRCTVCSGKKKLSYDYVKSYIESFDYTLLSDTYKNNFTKLSIMCDKGHEYSVKFNKFKGGRRCPVCGGTQKLTYDYVKSYIGSFDYTLLSDTYKNSSTKLLIKCDKGHEYSVAFNTFKQGSRCPVCDSEKQSSRGELEIQEFIRSLNINFIPNDRTQLINPETGRYLELDIWMPSMKKAIEYNGTYWHTLTGPQTNDKIKIEQCKQLGINLLIVNEHNWTNNNVFEKEIIRDFVNKRNP